MEAIQKKKHIFLYNFLLIVICLAINIVFSFIARIIEIPYYNLYFDCVGTFLAAMLGGGVPGVIVGFLTNIINSMVASKLSIYYSAISVVVALISRFLYRRGYLSSKSKWIFSSIVISLFSSLIGSIIIWATNEFSIGQDVSASLPNLIVNTFSFTPFLSLLISEILINIIDKPLSLGIAQILLKICPQKIKDSFIYDDITLNNDDAKNKKYESLKTIAKRFIHSMLGKIVLCIIVFEIVLFVLISSICYVTYKNKNVDNYSNTCREAARVASLYIDGDKVDNYINERKNVYDLYTDGFPDDVKLDPYSYTDDYFSDFYEKSHTLYSSEYLKIENSLKNVASQYEEIQYMYVYRIEDDGCHVVFDIDEESIAPVEAFDVSFLQYVQDMKVGKEIDPIISDDRFGSLLTVYYPISNSSGEHMAYVCCDINMDRLKIDERLFIFKITCLMFSSAILLVVLLIDIMKIYIVKPINKLSEIASQASIDTQEEVIEQLDKYKTSYNYEIEQLYDSIKKYATNSIIYTTKLKENTETITNMQEAIIMDFANMVENRDKNTGDHVKKTSYSVGCIAEELRKEGIYTDTLTDDYIKSIVRCAPLHDIGKITVSDTILNKPGRLTPEEFEIMKKHTTAGRDILQNAAIINATNSDYLKEGINMAYCHHEWWDGSRGYPRGIKGEEIPLSARIMALADVFDALVSKRSYKEPFPFDVAINIIKEENGTHFDPNVANAFLNICEQFRNLNQ